MILFFILCTVCTSVFASLHITFPPSPLTAMGHVETCNDFLRLGNITHSCCLILLLFLIFLFFKIYFYFFSLAFLGVPGGISHSNCEGVDVLIKDI